MSLFMNGRGPYLFRTFLFYRNLSSSKLTAAGNLNAVSICNRHFQNQQQQRRELELTPIGNKSTQRLKPPQSAILKKTKEQEAEESIEDQLAKNKLFEFSLDSQRLAKLLASVFEKTMGKANKKISSAEDLIMKGRVRVNDKIITKIDQKVEKGDEIEIPFDFSQAFGTVKKKKSVKNRVKEKEPTILDRPFTKVIHILDVELEGNDENNKTADDQTYLIKARIWDEHDGKDEVDEDDD